MIIASEKLPFRDTKQQASNFASIRAGCAATQKDIGRLEKRTNRDLVVFKKGKRELYLEGINPSIKMCLMGLTAALQKRAWESWWAPRGT